MKLRTGIGLPYWGVSRADWRAHVTAEELCVTKAACDAVSLESGSWHFERAYCLQIQRSRDHAFESYYELLDSNI